MRFLGRNITRAALKRKVSSWFQRPLQDTIPDTMQWVRIPGLVDSVCLREEADYSLRLPLQFPMPQPSLRVAAVMHLFYVELAEEMLRFVENIPEADVYISTTSDEKKKQLEQIFSAYTKGKVEVRTFPNQGRDIAPTFVGFRDIYPHYDACVHLHSKKSPHATDKLHGWRDYSYRNILGSEALVRSILHILSAKDMGVVFPQYFYPVREAINWGRNFEAVKKILTKCNVKLDNRMLVEFPAGSMFWFKPQAIRQLWDNDLAFEDFPKEKGQIDGTLAHGIERSVLYIAEQNGYRWVKTVMAGEKGIGSAPVLDSGDEAELQANLLRMGHSVLQVHD